MAERKEITPTPAEQELYDSLQRDGQRYKDLLTRIMREKAHLFSNTGHWDTGVIVNPDTPEQRFEPKPVLELDYEMEGSQRMYCLTEEGIFLTGEVLDEEHGYQPIWDDTVEEIGVADYPRFASCALYEFKSREARFGTPKDK